MTRVPDYQLPALDRRFRPKADLGILSWLVQEAWEIESKRVSAGVNDPALIESITRIFEAKAPASDMEVLERYGMAKALDSVVVSIYAIADGDSYGRWDTNIRIPLARPVRVPARGYNDDRISTPAPWYFEADRGLTEKGKRRALYDAGKTWEEYCAEQDALIAASVPRQFVAPFDAYAASVRAYKREYRTATDWPKANRDAEGRYPTWRAICEAFPVLGGYVMARLATAADKRANAA